jgi:hypothetical protein
VAESNPDAREEIAATARCRQQLCRLPLDVIFFKISDLLCDVGGDAVRRTPAVGVASRATLEDAQHQEPLAALIRAAKRFPALKAR